MTLDVILATPTGIALPNAPVNPWGKIQMFWTGWDGRRISLTDRSSRVRLGLGARGMNMPDVDLFQSSSPARHGSRSRGHRWTERMPFWPLQVWGESAEEWLEADRDFWETMRPDRPGIWEVVMPDGTFRSLLCRFAGDVDSALALDPVATGWRKYGIDLIADDPFWRSAPVTKSFTSEAGEFFIDEENGSPEFHISPSSTITNATVENPGDLEAWSTWRARATPGGQGISSVTVGVSGQLVTFPDPISQGQTLEIRTDPVDQRAFLNGVEVTRRLTTFDFAPIPAGQSVPLGLSLTGDGTVTATFYPRYLRAW